jgi:hypothetical protein
MKLEEPARYSCANRRRRLNVAAAPAGTINGIDYLEVANEAQTELAVFFIHDLPLPPAPGDPPPKGWLTKDNLRIEGGVRVTHISIAGIGAAGNKLTVQVDAPGDFSTYRLRIVTSPVQAEPPEGYDPQLCSIDFSFKVGCPSDFDCRSDRECPSEPPSEPVIDYLAKDYASFRRLMFDRLSAVTPDWRTRNAADIGVAVVEMLAYVGDELSYYQDAVATEAYLGTARERISVRRHARLLDYFMHEGCNARTWVSVEVDPAVGSVVLGKGTRFLTGNAMPVRVKPAEFFPTAEVTVFESMHALTAQAVHNRIALYTWSDEQCCLPKGATRATLVDSGLSLVPGDFLLFEEVLSPTTGVAADADPTHRQVVRLTEVNKGADPLTGQAICEIAWGEEDALSFALCVSAAVQAQDTSSVIADISVARANIVLADHGLTRAGEAPDPPTVPEAGLYRPRLPRAEIAFAAPWQPGAPTSASASIRNDAAAALPAVQLSGDGSTWEPVRDLLSSDRFKPEFSVEIDNERVAFTRFGDDVNGRRPSAGAVFQATYRVGNGRVGNAGRETLRRVVTDAAGVKGIRNPLPAVGGTDPETIDEVRQFAPQAFRIQERAVTEADYERVAELHEEVQRARARFRWTGSWYTVFITIDRKRGAPVDADPVFEQKMREHLERFRLAGYDIEIEGPRFAPLDLELFVCVKAGYFKSDIAVALNRLFSNAVLPGGARAFFHPDNFTFGDPLYLSRVVAAAMALPGVASVEATRFQRLNKAPADELANGVIQPAALEIIQLDNDPNFPENGKIEFRLEGGL